MLTFNKEGFFAGVEDNVNYRDMKDSSYFVDNGYSEEYYLNYCEGWEAMANKLSCPD